VRSKNIFLILHSGFLRTSGSCFFERYLRFCFMKKCVLLAIFQLLISGVVATQNLDTLFLRRKIVLFGLETAGSGGIRQTSDTSFQKYSTFLWSIRAGGFVTPFLGIGLTGTYIHSKSNFITPPGDIHKVGYFARFYAPNLHVFRLVGGKKRAFETELYLELHHERATATFDNFESLTVDKRLKYNIVHLVAGSTTRIWRHLKLDLGLQIAWFPESKITKLLAGTRIGLDYFFTRK
jgi:hypothetical protein